MFCGAFIHSLCKRGASSLCCATDVQKGVAVQLPCCASFSLVFHAVQQGCTEFFMLCNRHAGRSCCATFMLFVWRILVVRQGCTILMCCATVCVMHACCATGVHQVHTVEKLSTKFILCNSTSTDPCYAAVHGNDMVARMPGMLASHPPMPCRHDC